MREETEMDIEDLLCQLEGPKDHENPPIVIDSKGRVVTDDEDERERAEGFLAAVGRLSSYY